MNVCRLPHKRRKGLCLTPKQQFRLMMQGPFLLCLCQRGAFMAFQMIFLFRCSFVPETERLSRVYACPMNETNGHTQSGKSVRMTVAALWNKHRRSGNIHTSNMAQSNICLVSIIGASPRPRTVTTLYLLKISYYCTVHCIIVPLTYPNKGDCASCTKS